MRKGGEAEENSNKIMKRRLMHHEPNSQKVSIEACIRRIAHIQFEGPFLQN